MPFSHPDPCPTILAVASDPGGARAVLPVLEELAGRHFTIVLSESATLGREAPSHWPRLPPEWVVDEQRLGELKQKMDIKGLVLGTGLQDPTPLLALGHARTLGIPSLMMLDNWTSYRSRMELNGTAIWPDLYGVMDQLAFNEAIREGVPPELLRITGHPGLASLTRQAMAHNALEQQTLKMQLGCPANRQMILFISEPVEMDQGADASNPRFRGYTEKTVLTPLAECLRNNKDQLFLVLAPHPRENAQALGAYWHQLATGIDFSVLSGMTTRQGVLAADGVAGMASLVLYESWLVGRPTLSLQPGLCRQDLASLSQRPGIWFVDQQKEAHKSVADWLTQIFQGTPGMIRSELRLHGDAAFLAADMLQQLWQKEDGMQSKGCSQ
ncbi:MAG: hypothetical protein G8345_13470 [Magnetococcales bacterium]|nr:hypothetical protein [Magnetococcales bacterium]NGZ27884.1 hypothetical protein [Magnetococcales bacterium]